MMLECGGLQYPGAPFAGWYQSTEIANRDFLDPQRYNLLYPLAEAMDLDTSNDATLWKDEVALELNRAVLHSYKKAEVSIVDHYTQADQFMDHMREETRQRGGCPADWVWIVPPQSGSLVSCQYSNEHKTAIIYHQYFLTSSSFLRCPHSIRRCLTIICLLHLNTRCLKTFITFFLVPQGLIDHI